MTKQGEIIVQVKQAVKSKCAWPGGYPLFVLMSDGESLCCECAKKELGQIAWATAHNDHGGWRAEGVDINWEDPALFCCHCEQRIESAYGEA